MVRLAADERPLVQPFSAVPIGSSGLRLAAVMKPSSDMLISKSRRSFTSSCVSVRIRQISGSMLADLQADHCSVVATSARIAESGHRRVPARRGRTALLSGELARLVGKWSVIDQALVWRRRPMRKSLERGG
jgi:hypothetical protein